MIFTAATVQFKPEKSNLSKNLESMLSLSRVCADRGAELIVFPEMSLTGYIFNCKNDLIPLAEPALGNIYESAAEFCLKYRCYLAYGFAERNGEKLYNSQNLIAPDGSLLLSYRKVHLFVNDTIWSEPGDKGFMSVQTPLGRLGMGICMDINYDDFVEFHCAESDYLLFSTNWLEQGIDLHSYWGGRLINFNGTAFMADTHGLDEGVLFAGKSGVYSEHRFIATAPDSGNAILFTNHKRL